MSASILVISEATPLAGRAEILARDWAKLPVPASAIQREIYVAHDGTTALEVMALSRLDDMSSLPGYWHNQWERVGRHLASDFSRQVLTFIEAPKDCAEPIPQTLFLQLRHVEVPPPAYEDYRTWRDQTIFDVVRGAAPVDVFLAYHSLVSTEPGVMFLSGFSGNVEEYTSVFTSERYQGIVRDAGTKFITGGDKGLYTKVYRRISG